MSQVAPKKPVFKGPELNVLNNIVNKKCNNIQVVMIQTDNEKHDSFLSRSTVQKAITKNTGTGNKSNGR